MVLSKIRLIALGVGAALAGAGAFVAACSSDDTITTQDAGNDVVTPPADSGGDDTGLDAGNDSAMFDGSVPDFVEQLAVALCHSAARCCFGTTDPPDGSIDAGNGDAGSFDKAGCLKLYRENGWEGSSRYMDQTDAGSLTLDTVKAANCINGVENVSCNIVGTDLANLRTACFGAFAGTKAVGTACNTALDCAAGEYCKVGSADAGTCASTRPVGGACGDNGTDLSKVDELCTWRGQGGDEYCQFYSDFASGTVADAGDWKCEAAKGLGGDCNSDGWCTAATCDFTTFKCTSPEDVYPQNLCSVFIK
jgi:hypothetical protein